MEKAQFRATREMVGLSQKNVADRLGYTVQSVKCWENPNRPHKVPSVAEDYMVEMLGEFLREVSIEYEKHKGDATLPYIRVTDESGPHDNMMNAVFRSVGYLLGLAGAKVRWYYAENGDLDG